MFLYHCTVPVFLGEAVVLASCQMRQMFMEASPDVLNSSYSGWNVVSGVAHSWLDFSLNHFCKKIFFLFLLMKCRLSKPQSSCSFVSLHTTSQLIILLASDLLTFPKVLPPWGPVLKTNALFSGSLEIPNKEQFQIPACLFSSLPVIEGSRVWTWCSSRPYLSHWAHNPVINQTSTIVSWVQLLSFPE